jgi:hypothetical protein
MIKFIKRYLSPEQRIARLLRRAAKIAGENYYQIAYGHLSDRAREFEKQ